MLALCGGRRDLGAHDGDSVVQLNHPKLKAHGLDLAALKGVVKADAKQRFDLILESAQGVKLEAFGAPAVTVAQDDTGAAVEASATSSKSRQDGIWWIKARQGHSIKVCFMAHYFMVYVVDGDYRRYN